MENLQDMLNNAINEAKSNSILGYYQSVINDVCHLIEIAPYGSYTLNSSDIERAVSSMLKHLQDANYDVNEESMNGNVDPDDIKKDAKLKAFISKSIMEAIHTSVGNDYNENFS